MIILCVPGALFQGCGLLNMLKSFCDLLLQLDLFFPLINIKRQISEDLISLCRRVIALTVSRFESFFFEDVISQPCYRFLLAVHYLNLLFKYCENSLFFSGRMSDLV